MELTFTVTDKNPKDAPQVNAFAKQLQLRYVRGYYGNDEKNQVLVMLNEQGLRNYTAKAKEDK